MIGQTISHYKILDKLGEGGMGIVYKAEDTKLDRTVALKFLPAHVSVNEETKARFMQEAKAAAALNHANICTIHGVEEDGGQMFIVMEYIEGGTLREKIPIAKLDDTLAVAAQIGEALQEAHAKGIVHRDIKADNIMLTSKGQAKVMDFGLAKLKGSLKLTKTSSTVGTLGYMAPEQIQGGEIDLRSDVFSYGVLLFEMLTGKLPFRGEHEAAMVYSIVNEDPQPIEQLRQDISPMLSNLIARCLEKDPADRYQHMDDLVSELKRTQKKTSRVMRSSEYRPTELRTAATPSGGGPHMDVSGAVPSGMNLKSPMIRYGAIGFGVIIVGVIGWFLLMPKGITVNPDMNTRVLQVPFTQYSYPSLSPDGKWISFPAADVHGKWDIYYMHVNGGEPRKITSDATEFIQQSANISPDGSQVAYDKPNEKRTSHDIYAASALGGSSRKLADGGSSLKWRPDGQRMGFIRTENARYRSLSGTIEFWTVASDGTDLRREFTDSLFNRLSGYRYGFCWSPDGRSVGWIRTIVGINQVIILHNLETGEERPLTSGEENIDDVYWTAEGRMIFSSNRGGNTNLWAMPISGGEAVQVTKGAGPDIGLSVAASGNELVYLQQQRVGQIWTARIDGSNLRQLTFDDRDIWEPSFSPDKKRIAFVMNDPDPLARRSDLYVMDRDGNNRRKLTNGLPVARFPIWTPDGRSISYTQPGSGLRSDSVRATIYILDPENPGAPKQVGNYFQIAWIDAGHILSTDGVKSYLNAAATGECRRFFADSTVVWNILDERMLVYFDRRTGRTGWWIAPIHRSSISALMAQPGDVIMPELDGTPRRIIEGKDFFQNFAGRTTRNGDFPMRDAPDKVRIFSPRTGTSKVLAATFPGLRNRGLSLSEDGTEIVFVTPRLSSRLVLLENVFK
ncbi:MAG TPA: protein kinase [Bacteroidota bacterium]